jgi:hypothetical protein
MTEIFYLKIGVAASNEKFLFQNIDFLKPDGQIVWVMGQATMENSENQVVGYVGTLLILQTEN